MKPLVSIAMITYNHEKFIEKAINSILEQKHDFKIEIVIGEDYSQDKTREKLKKYENLENVKIIKRNKNIGVANNILEVYSKCTGKYIALLEGDDYWTDSFKLQKMINFLENNNYIGAFSEVDFVDGLNELNVVKNNQRRLYKDIQSIEDILDKTSIPTCTLVFKNIWGNDFHKEYKKWIKGAKYICDLQLKALLAENGKIKYFPEKMSAYRYITTGGSSYSSQSTILQVKDTIKAYQNIYHNISKKNYRIEEEINFLFFKAFIIEIKKLNLKSIIEILNDNKSYLSLLKILKSLVKKIKKRKERNAK